MKSVTRISPMLSQALRAPALAGPSRLPVCRAMSTEAAATPAPAVNGLPPNLSFADLAGAQREVHSSLLKRGEKLHSKSSQPREPIEHPLSSLASLTPTAAIEGGDIVLLPTEVFGKPLRRDILHRNVVWYLSTLRKGNQHTKSRSTVAYSGKKVLPQKGTGRARAGDKSSGIRKGGAPIHALHNRDWAQDLPRKVRELGVRTALSAKLDSGLLRVVADFDEGNWTGTRDAAHALGDGLLIGANAAVEAAEAAADGAVATVSEDVFVQRFGPRDDLSILFVYATPYEQAQATKLEKFYRKIRNLPKVDMIAAEDLVTYDILKYRWLVLEQTAVDALSAEFIQFDFDPAALAEFEEQLLLADAAEAAEAAKQAEQQ